MILSDRHHETGVFGKRGKNAAGRRFLIGLHPVNIQKSPRHAVFIAFLKCLMNLHGVFMLFHVFFDHRFEQFGLGRKSIKSNPPFESPARAATASRER